MFCPLSFKKTEEVCRVAFVFLAAKKIFFYLYLSFISIVKVKENMESPFRGVP
jgi:hypothetical protein